MFTSSRRSSKFFRPRYRSRNFHLDHRVNSRLANTGDIDTAIADRALSRRESTPSPAESGKINNSSQSAQRHAFSYSVIDLSSSLLSPLPVIDLFKWKYQAIRYFGILRGRRRSLSLRAVHTCVYTCILLPYLRDVAEPHSKCMIILYNRKIYSVLRFPS